MFAAMKNMIAFAVIFFVSLVESAPYSKYGRTCKDIGCPSNEVCIMAEDPCTYSNSQCGRYPTCKKMSSGEQTCRTFICPSGQYCKTDNGRPVCVNSSPGLGYDSAVNGAETNSHNHGSHTSNSNPFENANAPPADDVFGSPAKPYHPVDSNSGGNNNGYPPYPTNQGNNQQEPGRNDGYPPYPTNNRMPLPGQSGSPYGQSGYPQPGQFPLHPPPGYPQQPPNGQRYPGQNPVYPNYPSPNYPNQNYPQSNSRNYNSGYRRNAGTSLPASSMMMITTICFALFTVFKTGFVS